MSILISGCANNGIPPQSSLPQATEDNSLVALILDTQTEQRRQVFAELQEIQLSGIERLVMPEIDLWQRARDGFQLDLTLENRRIKAQRDWYASHQAYIDRVADRAGRYLFDVVEQLERRNFPGELALLPIVESAFDPFAYSHGRASGMWQFIPGTGKRFSLKLDWWYDGRRDVVESTRGALEYLGYLYDMFDQDWLLALAAYNSGEGNVRRAIRNNEKKGLPTDFWNLDLPRETEAYVPKLLALAQLLDKPEQYGLSFKSIPNQPYFARVDIGSQIDLAQAAELAQIPLEEIYLLNPGFNQWATSPDGPHFLNIPVTQEEVFKKNLSQLAPEKRISWIRYKIKNGDSLSTIASRYRTSADSLRKINDLQSNRIRAGDILFIPKASLSREDYVLSAGQRLASKQESPSGGALSKQNYQVRSGDSFWTISRKFNVGMRQLASWNGMAVRDPLSIGKELVVWTQPSVGTIEKPAESREIIRQIGYKVRSGDSLARIAQKFNVSIADIESWNSISRKKHLQPGQRLKIYVDVTQAQL